MNLQKLFIFLGLFFLLIGIFWGGIQKIPFGKLPGDITYEKGNVKVYFPIMSSILISIILSLIFFFMNKNR